MAIYKCSWEVEPGTTRIKFNEWSERVLNPGSPDLKASALTTGPHCLSPLKSSCCNWEKSTTQDVISAHKEFCDKFRFHFSDFARIECPGLSLIWSESSLDPQVDSQSSIFARIELRLSTFSWYCKYTCSIKAFCPHFIHFCELGVPEM